MCSIRLFSARFERVMFCFGFLVFRILRLHWDSMTDATSELIFTEGPFNENGNCGLQL